MTTDPENRRTRLVEDAYRLADELLFPAAPEVDRTGVIPAGHWHAIADAGLFGIAAPEESGGPGLEFAQVIEIMEVMTSGCLTTAFTWLQHHGVVIALAGTTNGALRDELFEATTSGRLRAGVAYAGVVPTPPRMRATRVDGGWRFDGYAPFVSGWGIVDLLQVSARDVATDDVIAAILPIEPAPSAIGVTPIHLGAADGTHTVSLKLDGLTVPDDRVVSRVNLDDFFASQNIGVRINGTLPLGLLRRCAALLDISGHTDAARALRERGSVARTRLDEGIPDAALLISARAEAATLALDAAAALVAADGGRGLLRGSHPERLAREAVFTLVAASRPQLKDLLVARFSSG
ncbi:acyl-CoA dehydrogenase family protein [Gordonia hankookensis]|uniref:Acyl-CoA/acyl-ACP dehydrogenase n=1 Tax=Gordonia hankookensis TaxID=589403 RepID=A0ABR7WDE9_9ACTN|nr:acyl-CoA dehydrogenase family protein [Gordonia hankookensis]MBD1320793.1 acyl-CoA/acyl-ACP dehydrogenase [Gordonia hankookensis]